ncbi:MAG: alpha/beta fold hydrolase [Thiolinea sp.]
MLGYTQIGTGDTKVLVFHGWFGDYSVWEPMFKMMDTEQFSYVFIDYRGYGKSADLTGEYTMQEIAADANEVVMSLGWTDVHLVGHSMGGMAMQRFILDCDDSINVKSAFGVTPVPASGGSLDESSWPLFKGAITEDSNRYGILDFTTGGRLSDNWLKSMVQASREQTNEEAYQGYLNAWAKENFADEVSAIGTSVMVCVGEFDGAINADVMKATYMDWFDGCELAVIQNSGHYPMQETPVYLTTIMERFIAKHA